MPAKQINIIIGQRFTMLEVVAFVGKGPKGNLWKVHCDCGTEKTMTASNLIRATSCGCRRAKTKRAQLTRHGKRYSREYHIWRGIKRRCHNPNDAKYPKYGGQGIQMCDEWRNDFMAFYNHIGPMPSPQHEVDRFPNRNGNYESGNVRWATRHEQMRNTRSNVMLTFDGKTMCVKDWADRLGWSHKTIHMRLKAGWSVERALTTPPGKQGTRH